MATAVTGQQWAEAESPWWHDAVFYHVYLPSFQDGNDDGMGDLPGLHRRIEYLDWLGVDAVWVSPFCRSRMEDFGYDVTDYLTVDPVFGQLTDVDAIIGDLHARGMRFIMDLVVNHTSRYHPWFLAAASSRKAKQRHWYIWRDANSDGTPPNNWRSINDPDTPGSAWYWHEPTQQYLLCTFAATQPDLNWTNPEVVAAMQQVIQFWLERGVDGFRLDMVDFIGKDPAFADEPAHPEASDYFSTCTVQLYMPEILRHIAAIRAAVDAYPGRVTIGEVGGLMPIERLVTLHGGGHGLHLPHNFRLLFLPWQPPALRGWIGSYDTAITGHGWPNYVLSNHDLPRASTKGLPLARLAAMMLLTLRGTPFMYYGEELGMTNADVPAAQQRDPWRTPETGLSRDPSRTPMQWSAAPDAGFSAQTPWLPVTDDFRTLNVETERQDPDSFLTMVRSLINARRRLPALRRGTYQPLTTGAEDLLFGYIRRSGPQEAAVLLNFSDQECTVQLPDGEWWILLSTGAPVSPGARRHEIDLAPLEGLTLWRDSS